MKKPIEINSRFKGLIPPLSKEELETLEQNIVRDGVREPLVVWNHVLVDGHNRMAICRKHGLDFPTLEMEFADDDAACVWIIRNQLGRRNLESIDRVRLALELEPMLRAKAKEQQGARNDIVQKSSQCKPTKTREELAKIAGVSHDTVSKAKAVLESGNEELIEEVRVKEKSLNQAAKEVKLGRASVEVPEDAKEARRQAEADSEKLWALKSAWKRACKQDKEMFRLWIEIQ
tara:strand:+ start:380 stop:1075 length:696 start_codon:yes stop_codon:yes gene_type:complete